MDFTKVVSSDPLDKLKHILLFLTSIPLQFSDGNVHTGRGVHYTDMEYELTLLERDRRYRTMNKKKDLESHLKFTCS